MDVTTQAAVTNLLEMLDNSSTVNGGGGGGGGGAGGPSMEEIMRRRQAAMYAILLKKFDFRWDSYMIPLSVITVVLGFLANTWILSVGVRRGSLRSSSFHLLLMTHSLANFFNCICTYPIMILKYTHHIQHKVQSPELCVFWSITSCAITCVGLFCNGLVAMNRAASCYPHYKITSSLRSVRTAVTSASVVCVLCVTYFLIIALSLSDGWNSAFNCFTFEEMIYFYVTNPGIGGEKTAKLLMKLGLGISSLIPFIMCLVSYSVIVRYLLQQKISGSASEQRRKDKLKALITIIVVFSIFFVCRVPTMIIMIQDGKFVLKNPVLMWTPILDSTLNPIVYLITMPAFRPKFLTKGSHAIHPASGSQSQQPTRTSKVAPTKN